MRIPSSAAEGRPHAHGCRSAVMRTREANRPATVGLPERVESLPQVGHKDRAAALVQAAIALRELARQPTVPGKE